jgi:phenylacetate-coenzyme A ligase PaaK-like adenylate-forming protein
MQAEIDPGAELMAELGTHLDWTAAELAAAQARDMRALVAHARAHSPFWARRLVALDLARATPADLAGVPPLSKAELMQHWDEIVCAPGLTLARCEEHLRRAADEELLLDGHRIVASGGSTGHRAVIPYDAEEWMLFVSANLRWVVRWALRSGIPLTVPPIMVHLQSGVFTHASALLSRSHPGAHCLPITLPRAEIVRRLNELQPTGLVVYSSALRMLSDATHAGQLRIRPQIIVSAGEPLLESDFDLVREIWDAGVFDVYGASEVGTIASSDGSSRGLYLNEDTAIIELAGDDSRPVRPGERASRLYVTPLRHRTLPLFRYELTDEVTLLDSPAGDDLAMRRIDHVAGRVDDLFDYGDGITIHPIVFRSPLTKRPEISAYQVRQTPRGAEISIVAEEALDLASLRHDIEAVFSRGCLHHPRVRIERRTSIARTENGQKLRRFVPVSAG